jgi:hypothetical protein
MIVTFKFICNLWNLFSDFYDVLVYFLPKMMYYLFIFYERMMYYLTNALNHVFISKLYHKKFKNKI